MPDRALLDAIIVASTLLPRVGDLVVLGDRAPGRGPGADDSLLSFSLESKTQFKDDKPALALSLARTFLGRASAEDTANVNEAWVWGGDKFLFTPSGGVLIYPAGNAESDPRGSAPKYTPYYTIHVQLWPGVWIWVPALRGGREVMGMTPPDSVRDKLPDTDAFGRVVRWPVAVGTVRQASYNPYITPGPEGLGPGIEGTPQPIAPPPSPPPIVPPPEAPVAEAPGVAAPAAEGGTAAAESGGLGAGETIIGASILEIVEIVVFFLVLYVVIVELLEVAWKAIWSDKPRTYDPGPIHKQPVGQQMPSNDPRDAGMGPGDVSGAPKTGTGTGTRQGTGTQSGMGQMDEPCDKILESATLNICKYRCPDGSVVTIERWPIDELDTAPANDEVCDQEQYFG